METLALKAAQNQLYAELKAASQTLNTLKEGITGPMGLTPDSVRETPEYQAAKRNYQRAFEAVRRFNATMLKALR